MRANLKAGVCELLHDLKGAYAKATRVSFVFSLVDVDWHGLEMDVPADAVLVGEFNGDVLTSGLAEGLLHGGEGETFGVAVLTEVRQQDSLKAGRVSGGNKGGGIIVVEVATGAADTLDEIVIAVGLLQEDGIVVAFNKDEVTACDMFF